jgi:hypothetical protein
MFFYSNLKPHLSAVTDSDGVLGYFRQFSGRHLYMEQELLLSASYLRNGQWKTILQHLPQRRQIPVRFFEMGSTDVTVLFRVFIIAIPDYSCRHIL